MKHIGIGVLALLVILTGYGLLRGPQMAAAQEPQKGAVVAIEGDGHPFFAILYLNGKAFRSGNGAGFMSWNNVPEGDYELRIEASGYNNIIQRVHVSVADKNVFSTSAPKGEGTLVFGKAPTFTELMERLANLEKTVDELKKQIEQLKK